MAAYAWDVTMNTLVMPVNIGDVIRHAVILDFKNWSGKQMCRDTLPQAVYNLFDLLGKRRIRYVLVGGVALLAYVEGRNTQDIDLIMALSDLTNLPEIQISGRDRFFARGEYEGLQIDILLTENSLFEEVRQYHTAQRTFQDLVIPTATVEGLLLLKLYALPSLYRQGSFARVGIYENDIATLLHDYTVDVKRLENTLMRYLSDGDMAEIRQILIEIQQRIERYQNRSSS